jgi:hypothetical protein
MTPAAVHTSSIDRKSGSSRSTGGRGKIIHRINGVVIAWPPCAANAMVTPYIVNNSIIKIAATGKSEKSCAIL